jgi:hypothetical protein
MTPPPKLAPSFARIGTHGADASNGGCEHAARPSPIKVAVIVQTVRRGRRIIGPSPAHCVARYHRECAARISDCPACRLTAPQPPETKGVPQALIC